MWHVWNCKWHASGIQAMLLCCTADLNISVAEASGGANASDGSTKMRTGIQNYCAKLLKECWNARANCIPVAHMLPGRNLARHRMPCMHAAPNCLLDRVCSYVAICAGTNCQSHALPIASVTLLKCMSHSSMGFSKTAQMHVIQSQRDANLRASVSVWGATTRKAAMSSGIAHVTSQYRIGQSWGCSAVSQAANMEAAGMPDVLACSCRAPATDPAW